MPPTRRDEPDGESWMETRLLVLETLRRLDERMEKLEEALASARDEIVIARQKASDEMRTIEVRLTGEIAKLEVKSGVWGALAGCIPAIVAVIIWLLTAYGHR